MSGRALFAAAVPALVFLLCSTAAAHTLENPFEAGLIAGQSMEAGRLLVWNDAEKLYVKYLAGEGWLIAETHLAVAGSLQGIPQTSSGNPKVGKFGWNEMHAPPVKEYSIELSLDKLGFEPGQTLFIAAHAIVVQEEMPSKKETAWASGLLFPGNSWAMYFNYRVQPPKLWLLPEAPVTANFYHPGSSKSYFDTVLGGVPSGFDIFSGTWVGWCVDQTNFVYAGQQYNVHLYSSYDSELAEKCPHCADPDWDKVNYILNHKQPAEDYLTVQEAIWYFVNGGHYPGTPEGQAMVEDALANGSGFVPIEGQIGAIILDAGPGIQLTIIEVDP